MGHVEHSHSRWGRLAEQLAERRAWGVGVEVVVVQDRVSRSQPEPEPEIVDSNRMHWGPCTRHARERF